MEYKNQLLHIYPLFDNISYENDLRKINEKYNCFLKSYKKINIPIKGIVNIGDTCYIAVILQALAHSNLLSNYVLNNPKKTKYKSFIERYLIDPNYDDIFLAEFYSYILSQITINNQSQQDASEFFIQFINLLFREYDERNKKYICKSVDSCEDIYYHPLNYFSTINKFFQFNICTQRYITFKSNENNEDKKINVGTEEDNINIIYNIIIPDLFNKKTYNKEYTEGMQKLNTINNVNNIAKKLEELTISLKMKYIGNINLNDILTKDINRNNSRTSETNVYKKYAKNGKINIYAKEFIHNLSNIFVVFINRYNSDSSKKLTNVILQNKYNINEKNFNIKSIICHLSFENSSQSGHYVIFIKISDTLYKLVDDHKISEKNYKIEDINKEYSISCFMLFLEKEI